MENAPFKVGDFVSKDTLLGHKHGVVNRIFKTPNGWEMFIHKYNWKDIGYIITHCSRVSCKDWYKI